MSDSGQPTTDRDQSTPAGDLAVAINIGMRHAHFTINQLMVDDISEVILRQRRAEHRTSRLRRCGGHVFQFAVPPPDARSVVDVAHAHHHV